MSLNERETVIVDRRRSPWGIIVAILAALALIAIIYMLFFNGQSGSGTMDVDVPAVSVEVQPDGQ